MVQGRGVAMETLRVERIVANVGYRPDRTIYSELQVHSCYATDGPMPLASRLVDQAQSMPGPPTAWTGPSHGPESLRTSEPNFYILGSKSYGRSSQFLLSTVSSRFATCSRFLVSARTWISMPRCRP